jgi:hypothetical protein
MHHNLAWIRKLHILYDASTFDTDPFEPQPDGVQTIFPFWVSGQNGAEGYVELPYTLVQDISLFVLLKERTIDIWKQKLDWIAKNGGMALVNVHPDYVCFGGRPTPQEFPSQLYRELLSYVRANYEGRYWSPLPKELAGFAAAHKNSLRQEIVL